MTKPKENKDKEPEEKTQSDKDITDRIKNGEIEPRLVVEPLSFKLDERNTVYLTSSGQFYLSRFQGTDNDTKEEKWSEELKFSAPLSNLSLIKQGENWKIRYTFDNEIRQDSIDTMLTFLANKIKLDTGSSKLFAQFLYKFKTDKEKNKEFEIFYEPVAVVDGVIKINRTADQPTAEILKTLIELHAISTHPDSFFTSLLYDMISPFSYEIRHQGQKFPYRLLSGRTHGGKTSEQFLLTLKGSDQSIEDRKETLNTIKTIFTFGQQVEKSRLPFLVDDISNEWLKFHSEELKGGTDGVKFMARGTRAQTQIVYEMLGMPTFTMNQEPVIPLALKDRIIMSLFTEKNQRRQNKIEWERLSDQLKPGFMLNILKESMDGKNIADLIHDIHKSVRTDGEINQRIIAYAYELLKGLADRYSLKIPKCPKLDTGNTTEYDLLKEFCTYIATRRNGYDRDHTHFKKFSYHPAKKEGEKPVILVSSEGWNEFLKEHRIDGLRSMTDFVNEVKNKQIHMGNRWVSDIGNTYGIIIPSELIIPHEPKEKTSKKISKFNYDELL